MQDYAQNPSGAQQPDPVIGTPEEDVTVWDGKQHYENCQAKAEEFIIEQFTGQEVDEDALVAEAIASGLAAPNGGIQPEYSGELLKAYDIPVNHYQNATTYDLANELAQGHKVIIGVDAHELWGEVPPTLQDINPYTGKGDDNHAVVVSGIDTTDPNNPQVIISDPGKGDPDARYPLDRFLAAWQDSNFDVTATQEPVPSTAPEMANFDYAAGHIPTVAGMPYEEFTAYESDLAAFNNVLDSTDAVGSTRQTGWGDEPDIWTDEPSAGQTGWDDPADPTTDPGPSEEGMESTHWGDETEQLLDDADALIEQNDALLEDLQDGHLDTYGQADTSGDFGDERF